MASVTRYTRFVAWSKHSLWFLVVFVIVLLVWIASYNTGESGSRIVFSNVPKSGDLENIMWKPHYQGVDARGRPYTIIAEKATQLDENTVSMVSMRADMMMSTNDWVALHSGTGLLNLKTKQLDLQDGVDLFYQGGYEFRTDYAHVDIQQGTAYGDAPVQGQGPKATLLADGFSITGNGQSIRFNGSVRMKLYR